MTGAGRVIGFEIARLLVAERAKLVVNKLGGGGDVSVVQQAVDQLRAAGGEAVAETSSEDGFTSGQRVVEAALDHFRRIDIVLIESVARDLGPHGVRCDTLRPIGGGSQLIDQRR